MSVCTQCSYCVKEDLGGFKTHVALHACLHAIHPRRYDMEALPVNISTSSSHGMLSFDVGDTYFSALTTREKHTSPLRENHCCVTNAKCCYESIFVSVA